MQRKQLTFSVDAPQMGRMEGRLPHGLSKKVRHLQISLLLEADSKSQLSI
jgi:hypothetical protein